MKLEIDFGIDLGLLFGVDAGRSYLLEAHSTAIKALVPPVIPDVKDSVGS